MGELSNCPRCGALFVKTIKSVCPECSKEEEKAFNIVYEFIRRRENREATISEVVEGTGVEEDLIIKFIKEKRIRSTHFPNLTYECEKCGAPIKEGVICTSCQAGLKSELDFNEQLESIKQRNQQEEHAKANTYFAINKDKDKSK
ncbi:hypothetical protein RZN22_05535 [Bacillaceae bacterium S4-13-58]